MYNANTISAAPGKWQREPARKLEVGLEIAIPASDRRLMRRARLALGRRQLRVPGLDVADGDHDAIVDAHASLS